MGGNETSDLEWLKSSSRRTHSSITNSWKKDSEALQTEELTELRAAVSELAEATATAGIVESHSPLPAADIDSQEILALVVIELNPRIQRETENWLLGRILGSREEGGADLLAKVVSRSEGMEGTVVLVAATLDRLLEGAEEMGLLKEDLAGTPKVFSYAERHSFLNFREGNGGFLTSAEALHIVKHALDNLRADTEEHVPGEPADQLYPGKSIFRKLIASHLLREMYPLHDPLLLKELEGKWYGRLQVFRQPLKDIRAYFGESVAFYFAFLSCFTRALLLRSVAYLLFYFSPGALRFCLSALTNIMWSTLFLESWKRKSNALAFQWGTLQKEEEMEAPRMGFRGSLGVSPITGLKEPIFPSRERYRRIFLGSLPFVLANLLISANIAIIYRHLDSLADDFDLYSQSAFSRAVTFVPEVIHTVVLVAQNKVYRNLAKDFTEWENHRLASEHQNFLVAKLLVFYFVNSFGVHFYTAFCVQDLDKLLENITAQLITKQAIGQVKETILPYLGTLWREQLLKSTQELNEEPSSPLRSLALLHIQLEGTKDPYESEFEDYLELFMMFGYMTLFSSVCPQAAIWCLLNNLTEIRFDAFKLCKVMRRPFPVPAAGIGVWQLAFECLGTVAIVTNCALVWISPEFHSFFRDYPSTHILIALVACEHLFLLLKSTVAFIIADVPEEIRMKLLKMEFQYRQARKLQTEKQGWQEYQQCYDLQPSTAMASESGYRTAGLANRVHPSRSDCIQCI
ncbi:anoctamin-10 isoform X1 [Huso huso]|uniref:Anoctamin n=1 Tax=Huso huso TaxID=61971 RepID=A0ABR0Y8Z8_HUSHU